MSHLPLSSLSLTAGTKWAYLSHSYSLHSIPLRIVPNVRSTAHKRPQASKIKVNGIFKSVRGIRHRGLMAFSFLSISFPSISIHYPPLMPLFLPSLSLRTVWRKIE